jgi:uncharacterized protein YqgV (UPF0045/DUF77 family)
MEFAMFPTDKGVSVSKYVSRVVTMVRDSGAAYQLTPMGTIVETETMAEATDILRRAYAELEPDAERVYATAKFDIRKGRTGGLDGKTASVRERIGEVRT